jgi:hypothetical protein
MLLLNIIARRQNGLLDWCDDGYICCVGFFMTSCLYGENYRKIYVSVVYS